MSSRLSAFVIWALVALSAMYWGLRHVASGPRAPEYTVPVATGGLERGDLARLLGTARVTETAEAPPPAISSRFKLIGVIAPKPRNDGPTEAAGLALIAIDGKHPKAFRVGGRVDGDLVLRSVAVRSAALGPANASPLFTLQLPQPAAAATGNLPAPAMTIPEGSARMPQPPAYHRESGIPPPPPEAVEAGDGGDGTTVEATPIEEVPPDVPEATPDLPQQ